MGQDKKFWMSKLFNCQYPQEFPKKFSDPEGGLPTSEIVGVNNVQMLVIPAHFKYWVNPASLGAPRHRKIWMSPDIIFSNVG